MVQATWTTSYRVPATLLSDTEESVLGTEWHQDAISSLVDMLREVARRRGALWGVCSQIALLGLQHDDGTPYDPHPDVMVLARPLPSGRRASISVHEAGAPLFVAEIASAATVKNDVGDKRLAYAAIGVREYVVFDPDGETLSPPLRAWRLEAGVYVPWQPEADGSWHSASLDVALQATQPFLGIRDRDGQQIELSHEVRERLQHLEQWVQRAEQRAQDLEQQLSDAERAREQEARRRAELEEQLQRLLREQGDT